MEPCLVAAWAVFVLTFVFELKRENSLQMVLPVSAFLHFLPFLHLKRPVHH